MRPVKKWKRERERESERKRGGEEGKRDDEMNFVQKAIPILESNIFTQTKWMRQTEYDHRTASKANALSIERHTKKGNLINK